jgi:hypothetical protein
MLFNINVRPGSAFGGQTQCCDVDKRAVMTIPLVVYVDTTDINTMLLFEAKIKKRSVNVYILP